MQSRTPSIIREGWMDWLNKEVAEPRDMQFLAQVPSEVVPCHLDPTPSSVVAPRRVVLI